MGFWAAIPAIATAASSIYSALKKPKETGGGQVITAEPQIDPFKGYAGDKLIDFIDKYLSNYIPGETYPDRLTAGITPAERTSLDLLNKYLSTPDIGNLFTQGKEQILKTLAGDYMPDLTSYQDLLASPFVKSMTNISKRNLQDLIDQARAVRGGRGSYFTESALREEGDIRQRVAENLDAIIANYMDTERERERQRIDTERGRMLQAVPYAGALEEYEMLTAPLKKITAGETLGALERTIGQGDLERRYNEWVRARGEETLPLETAKTLFTSQAPFSLPSVTMPVTTSTGTNTIDSLLNIIGKLNWQSLGGTGSIWDKLGGLFKTA